MIDYIWNSSHKFGFIGLSAEDICAEIRPGTHDVV